MCETLRRQALTGPIGNRRQIEQHQPQMGRPPGRTDEERAVDAVEDQLDAVARRRARDERDVVLVLAGVDHDAALEDLVAREHAGRLLLAPAPLMGIATWWVFAAILGLRVMSGWRGRRAALGTIVGFLCAVSVLAFYVLRAAGGDLS